MKAGFAKALADVFRRSRDAELIPTPGHVAAHEEGGNPVAGIDQHGNNTESIGNTAPNDECPG